MAVSSDEASVLAQLPEVMAMDRITVRTERPYDVVVGAGASRLLTDVAADRRVALIHPASLAEQARELNALLTDSVEIIVPDAEQAKTSECLLTCWQRLAEAGFTRDDLVVSLGGGAATDLAGFVAATWLRGVDVVHLPTTVLAMADAAIGGKTGINLVSGKNLVGAFHQPLAVLCDTDLLGSLDGREVRSGLAEIVKCGFIADPSILECIRAAPQAVLDTGSEQFRTVLEAAVRVKAAVVASDPHEQTSHGDDVGRERLNYGHTLGHAVEAHERFTWRHGEADAIGMVFAAELSHRYLGLSENVVSLTRTILSDLGLPVSFDDVAWSDLRATMALDKKTRMDSTGRRVLRFVGIRAPGSVAMIVDPDEDALAECYRSLRAD